MHVNSTTQSGTPTGALFHRSYCGIQYQFRCKLNIQSHNQARLWPGFPSILKVLKIMGNMLGSVSISLASKKGSIPNPTIQNEHNSASYSSLYGVFQKFQVMVDCSWACTYLGAPTPLRHGRPRMQVLKLCCVISATVPLPRRCTWTRMRRAIVSLLVCRSSALCLIYRRLLPDACCYSIAAFSLRSRGYAAMDCLCALLVKL